MAHHWISRPFDEKDKRLSPSPAYKNQTPLTSLPTPHLLQVRVLFYFLNGQASLLQ
ncbi:hypothetical protein [Priestia megaterium]|uniref:hypothetical protein n=1 Tax=Priestia megaterium TaxID=1404 RepID=UPI003D97C794